ncbi:MAG: penicillin-binding transpeptidase domain-containing protein [Eubacteriales bacterium]
MWRNQSINDTYEPGSIFKVVTAAAALEKGVVTLQDTFSCPGFRIVEDRRIRCHKVPGARDGDLCTGHRELLQSRIHRYRPEGGGGGLLRIFPAVRTHGKDRHRSARRGKYHRA